MAPIKPHSETVQKSLSVIRQITFKVTGCMQSLFTTAKDNSSRTLLNSLSLNMHLLLHTFVEMLLF